MIILFLFLFFADIINLVEDVIRLKYVVYLCQSKIHK